MKNLLKKLNLYKLFSINLLISFFLIYLDQITKIISANKIEHLVIKTKGIHKYIHILPILNLVYIRNTGISFGLFNHSNFIPTILTYIISIICLCIAYLLYQATNSYKRLYFMLILSGAIGNLLNRFQYGYVIDFIDFHIGTWHFPAFNLADSFICIGMFLFLLEDILIKN